MVKNMLSNIEYDDGFYNCSQSWDENSMIKIACNDINYVSDKKLKSKKDLDSKYLFAVLHPISENIQMENIFIFDKWQKQKMWITSGGKTVQDAELKAFQKYKRIASCNHDFVLSGDEINGDALCKKCSAFVSEYFLNKKIHYAKYQSLAFHRESILFDNITVKMHLMSMVQEMAYDPNLDIDEKINLMCAGWMHHTNGQLIYNDVVENILKYFYLEPHKMYESIILKYYDCVDMIKFLLNSKQYDMLQKEINDAKKLNEVLLSYGMPHNNFLQSYILMGEQTILLAE